MNVNAAALPVSCTYPSPSVLTQALIFFDSFRSNSESTDEFVVYFLAQDLFLFYSFFVNGIDCARRNVTDCPQLISIVVSIVIFTHLLGGSRLLIGRQTNHQFMAWDESQKESQQTRIMHCPVSYEVETVEV